MFDLFLDTVPFPCGFTLCQALAAGMPAVISTSKESLHCGLWGYLQPLIDGAQVDAGDRRILDEIYAAWDRRDLFFVRTSGDYLALASELIENPDLRERAGRAARILMQRFFSDPSRMGRTISDHLMEIVDEKLGAAKTS